jgi:hypothetical protein
MFRYFSKKTRRFFENLESVLLVPGVGCAVPPGLREFF